VLRGGGGKLLAIFDIVGDPPRVKWAKPTDELIAYLEKNIPTDWWTWQCLIRPQKRKAGHGAIYAGPVNVSSP
jgi:hypothetical protein